MVDQHGLLFSFPDQSENFTLGFEAGMIWRQIEGDGALVVDCGFETGFPIHTANVEVVRRMATARGYDLQVREIDIEGWTAVRLAWVGTGKTAPRLSLVDA